jgi:hypothetical protein
MDKKKVHIVVHKGLVQAVWADEGLEVEVMIHDLDTEDEDEFVETEEFVSNMLPAFAKQIY